MTARLLLALVAISLAASAGCCCQQTCGDPCGLPGCTTCCFSLPRPIVWNGACNDCGPGPCESCADCPQECGLLPMFYRHRVCNQGCGEVYLGEWISDPPDCCDPCDPCQGCWTGQQGCCNLGPFQRLLAALHGYSYCPPPNCGPVCSLCNKDCCGAPHRGYEVPGNPGCATCGGGHMHPHGADVYYEGPQQAHGLPAQSVMEENWNIPRARPIPGKPIHKAQQPPRGQISRGKQPPVRPTQAVPQQVSRQVSQRTGRAQQPIGSGVRTANYQR